MSQFDYESNTISFYSEKQFETFVMKSNSISKYISVFVFIGLLITVVYLILILLMNNDKIEYHSSIPGIN